MHHALEGDESRPLFAFAGIWRSWRGQLKPDADPVELDVYSFLTPTPIEVAKPIHPNRMQVMLATDDEFDQWIDGSADEVYALARPYPAEVMHIVCKGENSDRA